MKILLATHFFPPNHPGGTEAYTLGLARQLADLGHEPHVICAEDWGQGDTWLPRHEDSVYQGIPVRRVYWNWELAPDPFRYLYDNPAINRQFARYLAELRPDVAHVTSCYAFGAGILREIHRAGLPCFLTLTDFWFVSPRQTLLRGDGSLCSGPESAARCVSCMATDSRAYRALSAAVPAPLAARGLLTLGRWSRTARQAGLRGYVGDVPARLAALQRAFRYVDVALAPSRFLREVYIQNGYPAERVQLSPYGLDLSWLADLSPRPVGQVASVGYIGQIEPVKGVHLLVEAFRQLPLEIAAELRIHGDLTKNPAYGDEVRRLAGDDPRIRFLGPFERGQMASVMAACDFLVVPSVWYENRPLVISEALAAGRPVIATDLAGMSEQVEHEGNGLLFPRGDVAALAGAIRRLLVEPGLMERLRLGIQPVRTIGAEVQDLVSQYHEASMHARGSSEVLLAPAPLVQV